MSTVAAHCRCQPSKPERVALLYSGLSQELAPGAAGLDLADGMYASEETLQSSVAFLRNTLAGLGFCTELNLLSAEPG